MQILQFTLNLNKPKIKYKLNKIDIKENKKNT